MRRMIDPVLARWWMPLGLLVPFLGLAVVGAMSKGSVPPAYQQIRPQPVMPVWGSVAFVVGLAATVVCVLLFSEVLRRSAIVAGRTKPAWVQAGINAVFFVLGAGVALVGAAIFN